MKFCKDCKYCGSKVHPMRGFIPVCLHPQSRALDMVKGEPQRCENLRGASAWCGVEAKWFEGKENE